MCLELETGCIVGVAIGLEVNYMELGQFAVDQAVVEAAGKDFDQAAVGFAGKGFDQVVVGVVGRDFDQVVIVGMEPEVERSFQGIHIGSAGLRYTGPEVDFQGLARIGELGC